MSEGRVAPQATVVSYGACNGLATDAARVWQALIAGEVAAAPPPLELPFETVCGVVDLPPLSREHARHATRLLPMTLAALEPVLPALERARARHGSDRLGLVFGSSTGGLERSEAAFAFHQRSATLDPGFSLDTQHSFFAVPEYIATRFRIEGPCYTLSTACSSSAKAIGSALRLIRQGVCDAVLVGGADSLCETTLRGFSGLGLLSTRASRPFCRDRDGIHIGEGAAFLLLEADGDGPVRIASVGESSDAHAMAAPHPEGRGAATAMGAALSQAGLTPDDVGYLNAHGTGTPQNDVAESAAIAAVLPKDLPVSSTKGATGHMLGAAGITEALFSVMAVERGVLPPNTGLFPRDPGAPAGMVTEARPAKLRVALSNSLAFGGNNACVAVVAS